MVQCFMGFALLSEAELLKVRGGAVNDIGTNLKMLRLTKGVTQLEVARAIQVDVSMISAYEHGRHCPSVDLLIDISDYFDTSIDNIVKH